VRSLLGFSSASQVSLEVSDLGDYVCRKCRLGDSCTDVALGDDANVVEHHLHDHVAARHDGAALGLERLLEHFVGGARG
jgi:hypothetical protein